MYWSSITDKLSSIYDRVPGHTVWDVREVIKEKMISRVFPEIKGATNVKKLYFGVGAIGTLEEIIERQRRGNRSRAVVLIDEYFCNRPSFLESLPISGDDQLVFVPTDKEPTSVFVDSLKAEVVQKSDQIPCVVVGIGGGSTLDCAKALSNLLTNPGEAADYQGWDLVRVEGVYKVGVPTLSGTGAEATRTCVMTNHHSGVKLGMNSEFSVFDEVILDPDLTVTVPRGQYFFSGMDAYIHCIESLGGHYRHPIGDVHSESVVQLCKDVFSHENMKSDENRSKLMVASYLGGSAIGMTLVGLIHPLSAGLSVVLGSRHCVSNCIVMRTMENYYPQAFSDFMEMVEKQEIEIPTQVCSSLTEKQFNELYDATIVHSKPLVNMLGEGFREIFSEKIVRNLFEQM